MELLAVQTVGTDRWRNSVINVACIDENCVISAQWDLWHIHA